MKKLILSGIFVSFGLFVGRLSGFVREAFIASSFGATETTDLIIVFLSTPDILVNLLVGGALGMALIPEFKQLGVIEARRLYQQVLLLSIVLFTFVALLAYFFSGQILHSFAPGLSNTVIIKYRSIYAVTFLAIPLTVAAGVTTAYLHYENKFIIPALGTFIFNIILIFSLYLGSKFNHEHILVYIVFGICVGALVRWFSQILNSKTLPFTKSSLSNILITNILIRRYLYCVLTGGVIFLIPVVARSIASQSGVGELSLVNYSIKLVEFPLGVILTVFSIVFFPLFSSFYADGNDKMFLKTFKQVLLSVIAISFAIFIPLSHFYFSIVNAIYDWGQLEAGQLNKISIYFKSCSLTLIFQGVNALLISVFSSRKDTLTPLLCSTFFTFIFTLLVIFIANETSDIFNFMVFTYAMITLSLLIMIRIKHNMILLNDNVFVFDFFKLVIVAMFYHWLLSEINLSQGNLWLDIFLVGISSLFFLVVSVFLSQNIRKMIKI